MTSLPGNDRPRTSKRSRRWLPIALAATCAVAIAGLAWSHEPAPHSVQRDRVIVATVEHAEMKRQVRGPGRLVPRRVRWVTATVAGRVERVTVQSGDHVDEPDAIVVLANPDVELAALEAAHAASAARAELINLKASLRSDRLAQKATISGLRIDLDNARRTEAADSELAKHGLVASLDLERSRGQVSGLTTRVDLEGARLSAMRKAAKSRVRAKHDNAARLDDIARFRKRQRDALTVCGGAVGIVQDLQVEEGQWVTPGQPLAKIARVGELVAELSIEQVAARELKRGQRAIVDTRSAEIAGHVSRVDPSVVDGAVNVQVTLDEALPDGARLDQAVDGVIEIETLPPTLVLQRPASVRADARVRLFKLSPGGERATATEVSLGKASFDTVQVLSGLREGDRVIVSRLTDLEDVPELRLD